MKKLSFIIILLWALLPLAVKATEIQGMQPDWIWFSIIWVIMGFACGVTAFLFSMLEKYQEEE